MSHAFRGCLWRAPGPALGNGNKVERRAMSLSLTQRWRTSGAIRTVSLRNVPRRSALRVTVGAVQVAFRKTAGNQCAWEAIRAKRTRVSARPRGGLVKDGHLPHDLGQFVAEAALGIEYGFWGLVAAGATFKSTSRKQTRPGRQLIADHRRELAAAELAVNTAVNAWMRGDATDAAASLSEMARRWSALEVDDIVVADWPSGIVGG